MACKSVSNTEKHILPIFFIFALILFIPLTFGHHPVLFCMHGKPPESWQGSNIDGSLLPAAPDGSHGRPGPSRREQQDPGVQRTSQRQPFAGSKRKAEAFSKQPNTNPKQQKSREEGKRQIHNPDRPVQLMQQSPAAKRRRSRPVPPMTEAGCQAGRSQAGGPSNLAGGEGACLARSLGARPDHLTTAEEELSTVVGRDQPAASRPGHSYALKCSK
jgi:hypothetical protein